MPFNACNLSELTIEGIIKRLSKDIVLRNQQSYYTDRPTVASPLTFFGSIAQFEPSHNFGRENPPRDNLRLAKLVAIFDRFNTIPESCMYCHLPYSFSTSWLIETQLDNGEISQEEYDDKKKAICMACTQVDYQGYDFYQAFSYYDSSSSVDSWKEETGKLGPDDALLTRYFDKRYEDFLVITNFHKIWNATSIEEVQKIVDTDI